eukprot:TRINITY_DN1283_c0_g1_i1.p2 TRINITY_DN1283_c0_g1~~TRINITY_DN1283_c0_g1_i1.p2  ORF type:complete len:328 (-),score=77.33 TRINITY_DN1283_c0_g1_i1:14-997(-)
MDPKPYAKLNVDMIFWKSVIPYFIRICPLVDVLQLSTISKNMYRWVHSLIDWEALYLESYGSDQWDGIFAAFQGVDDISAIPMSLWKQEYIFTTLALQLRCICCYKDGGFSDGEFYTKRRVSLCQGCWIKQVIEEEKKEKILINSLGKEKIETLQDMDLSLSPSFYFHQRPCYLRCDIENYIVLVGGSMASKDKGWRGILKEELMNNGIDEDLASHHAYTAFPEDGTKLKDVISEIISAIKGLDISEDKTDTEAIKKEVKERREALTWALKMENIDPELIEQLPYKTVVDQYLEGVGRYNLQDIIAFLGSSAAKRNNLLAALDNCSH